MQKIDLLAASRCNMFSHVLANYQSTLLHFWEKTSRTMTAVSESFKGYQYYEFNMLKVCSDSVSFSSVQLYFAIYDEKFNDNICPGPYCLLRFLYISLNLSVMTRLSMLLGLCKLCF